MCCCWTDITDVALSCVVLLYYKAHYFRLSRAIVSCSNSYWADYSIIHIHKIQLQVNVELKYYDHDIIINADINRAIQQRNRAKLLDEYNGMIYVNYTYSPNSKIQISSACLINIIQDRNWLNIDKWWQLHNKILYKYRSWSV